MAFEPKNITKEHILRAIDKIEAEGIVLIDSTKWLVEINEKQYPPKEVMRYAHEQMNGEKLWEKSGGEPTNSLFENFGFKVTDKNNDPVKLIIEKYKEHIRLGGLKNEIYKWELVKRLKGRPDIEAPDFALEIKDVNPSSNNMVYQMAKATSNRIAMYKPEEYRNSFQKLFNEELSLDKRINDFQVETLSIYKSTDGQHSSHHDERTISTYLTFYNPDKYTFYKSSYYNEYCKLLGIKPKEAGGKYVHYLELIHDLVNNYILEDSELLHLIDKELESSDCYPDKNHLVLAQDILYQSFMPNKEEVNYWVFQGNPKVFDFETALKEEILTDWTVSAHKDKINTGDKVILWITGSQAGCYALCEVTSEPHEKTDSPDDHLWKEIDKSELKADIQITHNFVNNPILKEDIVGVEKLKNMLVGNQGTKFKATKEEYEALYKLATTTSKTRYWLYAPGENAELWDEFYMHGIIGLGWEELGDLNNYSSKEEIVIKLQEIEKTTGSKKNDATANFEFKDVMSIGDIVIAKKGKRELLGYGIVTSDYYFDKERTRFQKCRTVDWKINGNWKTDHTLVIKTLTDVTKYPSDHPDYETYYERLLGLMKGEKSLFMKEINLPLNLILFGPPGTGKTYNTINKAIEIINPDFLKSNPERTKIKEEFERLMNEGQIVFTTFHQSMSYEDFIEGIKPVTLNEKVFYNIQDGIFKKICQAAQTPNQVDFSTAYEQLQKELVEKEQIILKTPTGKDFKIGINSNGNLSLYTGVNKELQGTLTKENIQRQINGELKFDGWGGYFTGVVRYLESQYGYSSKSTNSTPNFVLIIDEINRGNVSQIFGELITLIEDDKRLGNDEALEVTLPYSKEKFGVPSNLYIIGTMNTADRSVEALDAALRRRFSFEEMQPNPKLIETHGKVENGFVDEINLVELLEIINQRIEVLLDKDHQIGHSYFMNVSSLADLKIAFQNKIIPLLQEYFFGDYGKIGLVLGSGFITAKSDKQNKLFANFTNEYDAAEFSERLIYRIENVTMLDDDTFKIAIKNLLNN